MSTSVTMTEHRVDVPSVGRLTVELPRSWGVEVNRDGHLALVAVGGDAGADRPLCVTVTVEQDVHGSLADWQMHSERALFTALTGYRVLDLAELDHPPWSLRRLAAFRTPEGGTTMRQTVGRLGLVAWALTTTGPSSHYARWSNDARAIEEGVRLHGAR